MTIPSLPAGAATSYTVTATAGAGGFIAPSGPRTANPGAPTTFTITTNPGYTPTVTGCGGSLSGTTYTTAPITGNCAVSARFSPQSHLVSATAGAGGIISPASRTVVHSDTTTFTLTPNAGYTAIVTGCGGILSGNTYTTGPVIGACTVSARFSPPAATLVVTNLNDSGPGSLRQALADAETMPGDNVITFQPGLTGTIVLTSGELVITSNLAIYGPGASVLAVSGNHTSRVFLLSRGSLVPEVVILDGLTIKDGFAAGSNGGGIATTFSETALTVSHCTLSGNASDQFNVGGGIYGVGDLTVSHSILTGNVAGNEGYAQGGGISQGSGALTISHSTLSGNSARIGGGISCGSGRPVTIIHSTLSGNSATIQGGGIYVGRIPAVTIIHSILSSNSATLSGGGIYNPDSVITITDSTVSNNTSNTSGYNGGGILNGGWLTMINSTVSGNSTGYDGGGIYNGRWLTMINSTVSGNSATGYGGGISDNGGTTLGNSLVAGNTAANGREVACPGFVSSYLSLGHNLLGENGVSGTSGICVLDPSDLILPGAVSTALGPLADNGGPTQTHLPVVGSLALDAGDNALIPAGVTTDQRGTGFPRLVGGKVDIGAVEGFTPPTATGGASFSMLSNAARTITYAAGRNAVGQLGAGPTLPSAAGAVRPQVFGGRSIYPVRVYRLARRASASVAQTAVAPLAADLPDFIALVSATAHTVALGSDGSVWAWGDNANSQLGDGTTQAADQPIPVLADSSGTPLTGVIALAAGRDHSVAVKSDGTVWTWGNNFYGQLGDNSSATTTRAYPVQVLTSALTPLTGVWRVAASDVHTVAVKTDGTVWTWGDNAGGYLGTDDTTAHRTAVQVQVLNNVQALVARGTDVSAHTIAQRGDGSLWGWGDNRQCQLGDTVAVLGNAVLTPVRLTNLSALNVGLHHLALGEAHGLARKGDGTAWAWGDNSQGQVGDGATTTRCAPVQVTGLSAVETVGAGADHSFVTLSDGTVWGWGSNDDGQLGVGDTTPHPTPTRMLGENGAGYLNLKADATCQPDDIIGDGSINALDVVAVINAVLGIQPLPAADVNCDGNVNALDVVFVINQVLGL